MKNLMENYKEKYNSKEKEKNNCCGKLKKMLLHV